MRTSALAILVVVVSSLAGCATPPPPVDEVETTVVLMPDEDGNVGKITVTTPQGSHVVDRAYTATTVRHVDTTPSADQFIGEQSLTSNYQALIAAQPTKPRSFILYFGLGTSELTADSRAQLPEVLRIAHERKPTEITIFGYADATGTEIRNEHLSAERARVIEAAMRKFDPQLGHVTVQYFGSKNPVVATPSNVPEAKNRRAEIFIL